ALVGGPGLGQVGKVVEDVDGATSGGLDDLVDGAHEPLEAAGRIDGVKARAFLGREQRGVGAEAEVVEVAFRRAGRFGVGDDERAVFLPFVDQPHDVVAGGDAVHDGVEAGKSG